MNMKELLQNLMLIILPEYSLENVYTTGIIEKLYDIQRSEHLTIT